MTELEKLKAEYRKFVRAEKENQELMRDIQQQLRILRLQICCIEYGVRPGSLVKNDAGQVFRVVDVFPSVGIPPALNGNLRYKNGRFSKENRAVHGHWEKV